MKHTPGPWFTGAWSSHGIIIFKKNQGAQGTFVGYAQGYPYGQKPTDEDRTHFLSEAEAEANARLIAAAPELLEALQDLLGLIHRIEERTPIFESDGQIYRAEAAIRMAEGK